MGLALRERRNTAAGLSSVPAEPLESKNGAENAGFRHLAVVARLGARWLCCLRSRLGD